MGSQFTAAMPVLASVLPITDGEERRGRRRAGCVQKNKEDEGGDPRGATVEDQKEGGGGEESMEMVGKYLLFSSWIGLHPSPPPPPHTNSNTGHIGECRVEQFSPSLLVRWEEEKYEDGVKWKFLEHKGPYFPPEYQPLPGDVHFYYGGEWSSDAQGGWRGSWTIYLCFKKRRKERKRKKESIKWWQNSQCISLFNTFACVRLNASQLTIIPQLSMVKMSQKTCEAPDFLQNSHIKTVSAQTYQLNTITVVLLWLIDTWWIHIILWLHFCPLQNHHLYPWYLTSLIAFTSTDCQKYRFSSHKTRPTMHDLIFRMPKALGVKRWLKTIIIFASFSSLATNWELVWSVNSWAWRSWLWLNLSCGPNVNLLPCQIISVLEKKSLRKVLITPPGLRGFDCIYWPMRSFFFSWFSVFDFESFFLVLNVGC